MPLALHRELGLTDDEPQDITGVHARPASDHGLAVHEIIVSEPCCLGRHADDLELVMFAAMWSEHCSYKSSRVHVGRFPFEALWVIAGFGENAGVVDVVDGIAVALRIESHNHPSAIEPYQGAAT